MRRLIYPLLAMVLVAGAFWAYWEWQGGVAIGNKPAPVDPTGLVQPTTDSVITHAKRPWFNQYDEKQRLTSQFRAGEFEPMGDGTYRMIDPEVIFHMDEGRRIHLIGKHGIVHGELAPPSKGMAPAAMEKPTRGSLRDVTIRFLQSANDPAPLTITMNNAVFDMQLLRVYTDDYIDPESNQKVPGDRVPVMVRGEDFDFDGQGLELHWNDLDRRLQLLEIQHGGRAVMKRPGMIASPMSSDPAAQASDRQGAAPAAPVAPTSTSPATETPRAQAGPQTQPATKPTTKPTTRPVLYRATFVDDVRVQQGEQQLAAAKWLTVDYAASMRESAKKNAASGSAESAKPQAIPQAASQPVAAVQPKNNATQPALKAEEPIVLTWTGPLKIVRLEGVPMMPIAPGEAAVRLTGDPTLVSLQGTDVQCGALTYHTRTSRIVLTSSDTVPQVRLRDARGLDITGQSIEYADEVATIMGNSRAIVPLSDKQGHLLVTWKESGHFHLVRSDKDSPIRSAQLRGDVVVRHPQMDLASRELDLAFNDGPDSKQLPLRALAARGDVHTRLADAQKRDTIIKAQALSAGLGVDEQGGIYARNFEATGGVDASSPTMAFTADNLKGAMHRAPGAQPNDKLAAVTFLQANKNVNLKLKDAKTGKESTAAADRLDIRGAGEQQIVELTGGEASFVDADGNGLQGPVVQVFPNSERLHVPGRGSLRVMQADGEKRIPIDVSWTGSLSFDSKGNRIVIDENVLAQSVEDAQHTQKATAGRMTLDLADAPPDKTSSKSKTPRKELRLITLEKHTANDLANVQYTEMTGDAKPLRTVQLRAERMTFDPVARRFEVPMPGQALIDDVKEGPSVMIWKDRFVYDEATNRLEITGDVWCQHRPKEDTKYDVRCPKVTVELAKDERTARTVLRRVLLHGRVTVAENDIEQFEAAEGAYDPETKKATARGTAQIPGVIREAKGLTTSTFTTLVYNLAEKRIETINGIDAKIRR